MRLLFKCILTFVLLVSLSIWAQEKKTVAILDFINTSKDASIDSLQTGIPESMVIYLANYKEFSLVERSRLQDAIKEMQLGQTGIVDEGTASKIGSAVGANAIIIGSYLKLGTKIRINARLIDVKTGKVLLGEQVQGDAENEIFTLLDNVAEKIANRMIGEDSSTRTTISGQEENKKQELKKNSNAGNVFLITGGIITAGCGTSMLIAGMKYSTYQKATTSGVAADSKNSVKTWDKISLISGIAGGAILATGIIIRLASPESSRNTLLPETHPAFSVSSDDKSSSTSFTYQIRF